ncbi:MAG: AAA family ATPase [Promethearchaeia archaeon]
MKEKIPNFLVIVTGLPASGKSTFSEELKKYLEEDTEKPNKEISIVDPDKIREEIAPGTFDFEKESEVRELNLKKVEKELKKGKIVISDDLNYYTSMRRDLKSIANQLNKKAFIIHMNTPLETCLEWNKARGEPIPNDLIIDINQKFDSFTNYSWEEPILKINMERAQKIEINYEELMNKIKKELTLGPNKKEPIDKEKANNQRFNETLEEKTRKIIGELLQKNRNKKKKAKLLKLRKRFVKEHINEPFEVSNISARFKNYLRKILSIEINEG